MYLKLCLRLTVFENTFSSSTPFQFQQHEVAGGSPEYHQIGSTLTILFLRHKKIPAGASKIQTCLKIVMPMPFFSNWHCQSFKKSIWWEFSYPLLTGWFSQTASRVSRHRENGVYKGSSSLQLIGGGTPVGGERAPAVLTGCPLFRKAPEKEKRCTSTQGAVPTGKTCNPSHMCVFR